MEYEAVFETGSKQYAVSVGDIIDIPRLEGSEGDSVNFDQVLFARQGTEIRTGHPHIEGASVQAEIIGQKRGKTIIVFHFKRRTTYRKRNGHRQPYTAVRITAVHA